MKKFLLLMVVIVLVTGLVITGCSSPAPAPTTSPTSSATASPSSSSTASPSAKPSTSPTASSAVKLPDVVSITTLGVGTSYYVQAGAMRAAVEAFSPMKMRLETTSTDLERIYPLYQGNSEFMFQTGPSCFQIVNGIADYAKMGPTPLRRVWNGYPFINALFARGDAGFKTIADLKGKKVASTKASAMWTLNNESFLAYGGLTWNDVIRTEVASVAAGGKGPLENAVDAATTTPWSASAQELAASRYGIKWFEVPASDTAGWDRIHKVAPWVNPILETAAGFKDGKEKMAMAGYDTGIWAYPTVSNDTVYAFCKAMNLGYDTMAKMEPTLKDWTLNQAASMQGMVDIMPYHDGTVQFLKDMGKWTPDHEKYQQRTLALEKQRTGK
jgi:uncharacterized protein